MPDTKTAAVTVPAALYAEMEKTATAQERSVDDLAAEAVVQYLRMNRRNELRAYGERQAQKLKLREDLTTKYVHDARKTER